MTKKSPETTDEQAEWKKDVWTSLVTEVEADRSRLIIATRAAAWSGCDTCGERLIENYGSNQAFQHEIIPTSWAFKDDWPIDGAELYTSHVTQGSHARTFAARPNPLGYRRILNTLSTLGMREKEILAAEMARHCDYSHSIEMVDHSYCTAGLTVLSHCGNTKATERMVAAQQDDSCPGDVLLAIAGPSEFREAGCRLIGSLPLLAEFYPEEARSCALSRLSEGRPLADAYSLEALVYAGPPSKELSSRIAATLSEREDRWECLIPVAAVAGINVTSEMEAMNRLDQVSSCMATSLVSLARSTKHEHWDLLLKMTQNDKLARYAFLASAAAARDEQLLAKIVESTFTATIGSRYIHIFPRDAETIYLRFAQTGEPEFVIETFRPLLKSSSDSVTTRLQERGLLALSTIDDPRIAQIMTEATKSEWPVLRIIGMVSLWAHYDREFGANTVTDPSNIDNSHSTAPG